MRMSVQAMCLCLILVAQSGIGGPERANAQEALSPKLIELLKTSHAATCQVAIRNQSHSQGLGMTEEEIERHCRCVGDAYFESFSQQDFDEMLQTEQLPQRLLRHREAIQVECFVNI